MKTFADIEALYAKREADIAAMAQKGKITVDDVTSLDRLGRFSVAVDHWALCSDGAKMSLLNDQHPHVRSAARLALNAKTAA